MVFYKPAEVALLSRFYVQLCVKTPSRQAPFRLRLANTLLTGRSKSKHTWDYNNWNLVN